MSSRTLTQKVLQLNAQMLAKLLVIAVMMFGFGYALVPLYQKICELTGVNVLASQQMLVPKPSNSQIDLSREIVVELDANVQGAWRFRPTQSSIKVHPGELTQVVYEVVNSRDVAMDAQAIPSYAPQQAGAYFKKVECFCFKQQSLAAKEAKQMPVAFYIDPAIPKEIKTITLSYTFFEVGGKTQVKSDGKV